MAMKTSTVAGQSKGSWRD